MDLSDDIAYSVHDFEDAIVNGYLDPARLADTPEHAALLTAIQSWVGFDFARDELEDALYRLMRLPEWIDSFDGTRAVARAAEEPHLRSHRPVRPRRDDGDPRGVRHVGADPLPCARGRSAGRRGRDGGAQGHHRRRRSSRSRGARASTRSSAACSSGSRRRCGSGPTRSTRCTPRTSPRPRRMPRAGASSSTRSRASPTSTRSRGTAGSSARWMRHPSASGRPAPRARGSPVDAPSRR